MIFPQNIFYGLLFLLFTYASASTSELANSLIKKYGMENFKNVKEIHFTFNGKLLGLGPSRSWIWKPQSDSVTYVDEKKSYSRKTMDSSFKAIDAKFINDQYWLTFPFHLAWDKEIRITQEDSLMESPIKKEKLNKLVITYAQAKGYTPNDIYELFITPEGEIKEWIYYKQGNMKGGYSFTWEKTANFSGLLFSQEHKGPAGFRVYFTDILVK